MGNESLTMADVGPWRELCPGYECRSAPPHATALTILGPRGWTVHTPDGDRVVVCGPETGAAGRALADAALARMLGAPPTPHPAETAAMLQQEGRDRARAAAAAAEEARVDAVVWRALDRECASLRAQLATALRERDEARAALARLLDAATDVYVLACETDQIGPDYDRSENLLGTLSNAIDLARSGGPL